MYRSDYEKKQFQKNLVRLMNENGLTQQDLAKNLNVGQTTISAWVSGKTFPRFDALTNLVQFFNATYSDLLGVPEGESIVDVFNAKIKDKQLQEYFDLLTDDGQNKVVDYARDLSQNPHYQKKGENDG